MLTGLFSKLKQDQTVKYTLKNNEYNVGSHMTELWGNKKKTMLQQNKPPSLFEVGEN